MIKMISWEYIKEYMKEFLMNYGWIILVLFFLITIVLSWSSIIK